MGVVEILAKAVTERPRSYDAVRRSTGLKLSDSQLELIVLDNSDLFRQARFVRRDADGKPIKPSRPGLGLRRSRKG